MLKTYAKILHAFFHYKVFDISYYYFDCCTKYTKKRWWL